MEAVGVAQSQNAGNGFVGRVHSGIQDGTSVGNDFHRGFRVTVADTADFVDIELRRLRPEGVQYRRAAGSQAAGCGADPDFSDFIADGHDWRYSFRILTVFLRSSLP